MSISEIARRVLEKRLRGGGGGGGGMSHICLHHSSFAFFIFFTPQFALTFRRLRHREQWLLAMRKGRVQCIGDGDTMVTAGELLMHLQAAGRCRNPA